MEKCVGHVKLGNDMFVALKRHQCSILCIALSRLFRSPLMEIIVDLSSFTISYHHH